MFTKLSQGSHVHLMGICGTAMGSLAGLLSEMGYKVTGSDENVYPPMSDQLRSLGIDIMEGYRPENLNPKPDFVIVGNVITRNHSEAVALLESDIPYTSLPKALGELVIADRRSVVVSGTHGKTTTTSLFSWISESAGEKPGFLVGGIPKNFGKSFRIPNSDLFVIEGDEYDTAFFDKVPKFIHYKPKFVILTSVEFDHADIYDSMDAIRRAFRSLVELIPEDGILIANGDQEEVRKLVKPCKGKVLYYGFNDTNDYQITHINWKKVGAEISLLEKGRELSFTIPLFGNYNAMNAVATFALSQEMKFNRESVLDGFSTFKGVKRRQEVIGEPGGVTIIDDFAHHPEAVKSTIEAVQQRYRGQRVFSVFEPRSATSRSDIFQNEYREAFSKADHMILAKVFAKKILDGHEALNLNAIVDSLVLEGNDISLHDSADAIVDYLANKASKEDVILIMSNGGFDGIYEKLLAALQT